MSTPYSGETEYSLMGPAMQLIREVIIPNMQHTPGKGTPTQFRLVPFSIPGI